MINVSQRRPREFVDVGSADDVINILKSQFATRSLYLKDVTYKTEVSINEYLENKTLMLLVDPNYEHTGTITIYGLSDKYIEINLKVVEERAQGYLHCEIESAKRAVRGRRDLRFKLNLGDAVATNFKVSKHTIDISTYNIPTSIKVVLEQFQSSNSKMSDIVKVDVFNSEDKDPIHAAMRKTGKSLFVSDMANTDDYSALNDDFLDCKSLFENSLNSFVKKNIERGYKSMISVPIIYITESESSIPFGYIQLISKNDSFDVGKVLELKDQSFKLVDRIRDANTLLLPVHQDIVDISRGGAKLRITDDNLKKYILKSKGFIFDIVFKLQAPITIYGEIRATYKDDDNNLYVGVDFEGNSSRKGEMKRFYSILKPMEIEYKQKLIKSMKRQKKIGS